MGGKRIQAARVPRHLRFTTRFRPSTATGSEGKIASPKTWVADVSRAVAGGEKRIPPIASECVVLGRDLFGPRPPYPQRRWRPGGWTG
jgi:hypothetical protein